MTYSMSAIKGQGSRISLGDYEHESWLLHGKQKENITKRTYQLFSPLPTNTYTWQLDTSPAKPQQIFWSLTHICPVNHFCWN